MYLTGHHVSYRSLCNLQITMYLTGHYVSHRSPCILQVTMYLTGHHVSFMLHSLHRLTDVLWKTCFLDLRGSGGSIYLALSHHFLFKWWCQARTVSDHVFVWVVVPSQNGRRWCIFLSGCTKPKQSAFMYLCEWLYQARTVSDHVFAWVVLPSQNSERSRCNAK